MLKPDAEALKRTACETIDGAAEDLHNISQELWSNPELCYQEYHAHKVLTRYLEELGLNVTRNFLTDTGFKATCGTGGANVAILCEFDALPGIGHACGHNLIAEAGVGAAVGVFAALQKAGLDVGKVRIKLEL